MQLFEVLDWLLELLYEQSKRLITFANSQIQTFGSWDRGQLFDMTAAEVTRVKKILRFLVCSLAFVPFGGAAVTAGVSGHVAWASLWAFCLSCQVFFLAKFFEAMRRRPHLPLNNVVTGCPEIQINKPLLRNQRIAGNARERRRARRAAETL
jgi:hypothetical protein